MKGEAQMRTWVTAITILTATALVAAAEWPPDAEQLKKERSAIQAQLNEAAARAAEIYNLRVAPIQEQVGQLRGAVAVYDDMITRALESTATPTAVEPTPTVEIPLGE